MKSNIRYVSSLCWYFHSYRSRIEPNNIFHKINKLRRSGYCSVANASQSAPSYKCDKTAKVWSYDAPRFGHLKLRSSCHVHVIPFVLDSPPYKDKLVCKLCKSDADDINENNWVDHLELSLETKHSEDDGFLQVIGRIMRKSSDFIPQVQLQVPPKFDLHLSMDEASHLTIENMESGLCAVKAKYGDCTLKNLKSDNVEVSNKGGDIITTVIQGNVTLHGHGDGNIVVDRVQGSKISFTTEKGSINGRAVYADAAKFLTHSGAIRLDNLHGQANMRIDEAAPIKIGSLDGDLDASTGGHVDVYVSRSKKVSLLSSHGDVTVKVGDSVMGQVQLLGRQIVVDPSVKLQDSQFQEDKHHSCLHSFTGRFMQEGKGLIKATASAGNVKLLLQDWFSSMKLQQSDC